MGKPGQIGGIRVISGMLRLFWHYVLAQAGPDIEKALDPVLVFIRGTTNLFELVERRYFEHFENQPDMRVTTDECHCNLLGKI